MLINSLKKILRIGCIMLMPLMAAAVLVGLQAYGDYPLLMPTGITLAALLILFPLCLMQGKEWPRLFKSAAYIVLILVALGVIMPTYWVVTPRFIGGQFAIQWYRMKYERLDSAHNPVGFIGEQTRHEKISDDAALFSYPDPPVVLLVSTAEGSPHCTGYPQVAERLCTERLRKLIKTMMDQTPKH